VSKDETPDVAGIQRSGTLMRWGAGLSAAVALVLAGVYADEGGYVNHPNDRGGATNYGVTQEVARQAGYSGDMRYFPKHCSGSATICADGIYVEKYIVKPGFMPVIEADPAVGEELVNTGVNMGPGRPSKWFQQTMNELGGVGLTVDGRIGPKSVNAYRALQKNMGPVAACVATLNRLDLKQKLEYDRIVRVNPSQKVFYKGWINRRINNVNRKNCGKGVV
jgi:lysozyme family protein